MKNKNLFSREIQEVIATIGKGKNLPSVGANGKYNPKSGVLYATGFTSEIEQNSLILPKNSEEVGITNIDKARLKFPFVVTGIKFHIGLNPNNVTIKEIDHTQFFGTDTAVLNGELTIDQDGVLVNLPILPLSKNDGQDSQTSVYGVSPFVIREDKVFRLTPDFAGQPRKDSFYRVELHGYHLQPDATV